MGLIDARQPIQMADISDFLLKIAKKPLDFIEHIHRNPTSIPGTECIVAARLARQAPASIVSNCVVELWSATV